MSGCGAKDKWILEPGPQPSPVIHRLPVRRALNVGFKNPVLRPLLSPTPETYLSFWLYIPLAVDVISV